MNRTAFFGPTSGTGVARVLFFGFLLVSPAIAFLVAQIGFCDPDTCWHLALGKWFFLHQHLPNVDPFSSNVNHFVFINENMPLLQQEWLSDLTFYLIFLPLGYSGLLLITAIISVVSFVVIPSLIMARNRVPRVIATDFIILAVAASAFRLWVRPEEFSFLFMACLMLVNEICQTTSVRGVIACCLATLAIMALWTNFHAVFVIGILYLVGYGLVAVLELIAFKETSIKLSRTGMLLFAGSLGTLITPWRFEYWRYILQLTAAPILRTNKENGPMTLADLANPTFYPLLLLLLLFWIVVFILIARQKQSFRSQFFSVVVGVAATCAVVVARRMTPFALLAIFVAISRSFRRKDVVQENGSEGIAPSAAENYLQKLGVPSGIQSAVIGLFLCGITSLLVSSFLVPPRLPSPSRLFHPPTDALRYIESNRPQGRMLNDTKFGSMMSWCMDRPPDIFVDGRFDSACDRDLISEYNQMRLCRGNWRELLDKYKIGWVFFTPEAPIISALSEEPDWKRDFADQTAVILERKR